MRHSIATKPLALVIAGALLLAFGVVPPRAEAVVFLVPALIVVGAFTGIIAAAKAVDQNRSQRPDRTERPKANPQAQRTEGKMVPLNLESQPTGGSYETPTSRP